MVCCGQTKGRFVIIMAANDDIPASLHVGWVEVKVALPRCNTSEILCNNLLHNKIRDDKFVDIIAKECPKHIK